jgi:hypothetical protein
VLLLLTPDECESSFANFVYFGPPDATPSGS